jgi:hypothetical protein
VGCPGQSIGVPLVVMLDGTVGPVRAYNTNGLWLIPLERLADEASSLAAEGDFKAIKSGWAATTSKTISKLLQKCAERWTTISF